MIIGEFGRVICLRDDKRYHLQFSLAEKTWDTTDESKFPVRGDTQESYRWDARFGSQNGECNLEIPYKEIKRFPTFYFYLLDDNNNPVAFYRDSLENYKNERSGPIKWCSFTNNSCYRHPNKSFASEMFSFRLFIWDSDSNQKFNPKEEPKWRQKPPPRLKPYKMRINIYQCRNLSSNYNEETLNPYVKVWTSTKEDPNDSAVADQDPDMINQTQVCQDTCNPIYYESIEFVAELLENNNYEYSSPLIINVYDRN